MAARDLLTSPLLIGKPSMLSLFRSLSIYPCLCSDHCSPRHLLVF